MEKKEIQQAMREIMDKASVLEEARDIASAILASYEIRDSNDRDTVINALAYRLQEISFESTSIWMKAHDVWKLAENVDSTPLDELAELEEVE